MQRINETQCSKNYTYPKLDLYQIKNDHLFFCAGCMNFTYDPLDFAVKGNMFMDQESLYEYKLSGMILLKRMLPTHILLFSVAEKCIFCTLEIILFK